MGDGNGGNGGNGGECNILKTLEPQLQKELLGLYNREWYLFLGFFFVAKLSFLSFFSSSMYQTMMRAGAGSDEKSLGNENKN